MDRSTSSSGVRNSSVGSSTGRRSLGSFSLRRRNVAAASSGASASLSSHDPSHPSLGPSGVVPSVQQPLYAAPPASGRSQNPASNWGGQGIPEAAPILDTNAAGNWGADGAVAVGSTSQRSSAFSGMRRMAQSLGGSRGGNPQDDAVDVVGAYAPSGSRGDEIPTTEAQAWIPAAEAPSASSQQRSRGSSIASSGQRIVRSVAGAPRRAAQSVRSRLSNTRTRSESRLSHLSEMRSMQDRTVRTIAERFNDVQTRYETSEDIQNQYGALNDNVAGGGPLSFDEAHEVLVQSAFRVALRENMVQTGYIGNNANAMIAYLNSMIPTSSEQIIEANFTQDLQRNNADAVHLYNRVQNAIGQSLV